MRIVHVTATLDQAYGGPSTIVPPLCDSLVERGHDVTIVTTDHGVGGRSQPGHRTAGGTNILASRHHWPRSYGTALGLVRTLSRVVATADIVEIHSIYFFHTLVASRLARVRQIPYVVRPHGTLDDYHYRQKRWKKAPYERLIERNTLRNAAAIHCFSERERQGVVERGFKSPAIVIPPGADLADSADASLDVETPFLLFLGRISRKKNIDVLLKAYAMISPSKCIRLVVAGPDNEGLLLPLRRLSNELGVENRVDFVGAVYGDEKWALLRAATLFVLPSQDESFGVAVLEALSVGTPVVLSPEVALADEVAAAGVGWVTPPDAQSLGVALGSILEDKPGLAAAGRSAEQFVRDNYTWSRSAARLEILYLAILQGAM